MQKKITRKILLKTLSAVIFAISMTHYGTACTDQNIQLKNSDNEKNVASPDLSDKSSSNLPENPNQLIDYSGVNLRTIYLAGGCFWGLEAYMSRIYGIADVVNGYANGNTDNPTYEDLLYRNSGHAETVQVSYDPERISLEQILRYYLKVVDPTSVNRQGNDRGSQYRTGIYFTDNQEKETIRNILTEEQKKYYQPIIVEVTPLDNFTVAEEYHQDYLEKNPNGYCHIDLHQALESSLNPGK